MKKVVLIVAVTVLLAGCSHIGLGAGVGIGL